MRANSLKTAIVWAALAAISPLMISTAHANLSVGPPYDLGVYRNGSLTIEETRFEADSPFLASLREVWMTHFLDAINRLPTLPNA